jgi:hypothetical protein
LQGAPSSTVTEPPGLGGERLCRIGGVIPDDAPLGLAHESLRGWAVGVLILTGIASVVVAFEPRTRRLQGRVPDWLLIGGAALLLRGAMSLVQDGAVFDVLVSYRSIGDRVLHGSDVWTGATESLATYPPPIYGWWALAALVPDAHPHVFAALVRAPFWIGDAGLAVLLVRLIPGESGVRAGWIYALCPAIVAVPTLHGQHDPVTDLLLVVGVILVVRDASPVRGGLVIGVATALKQWPLFFLLPILAAIPRRRVLPFLVAVAVPLLLAFAGYGLTHPHDAVQGFVDVATYRPHREGLGTSLFFPDAASSGVFIVANIVVTVGAGVVAAVMVRRGWSLVEAIALDMILLVGLSPTVSDQYLMWAFPFLLLAGRLRTAALLGMGLLPAVVSLDLWQTVNDGDAPHVLLVIATLSCVAAAAWLIVTGPATQAPATVAEAQPRTTAPQVA